MSKEFQSNSFNSLNEFLFQSKMDDGNDFDIPSVCSQWYVNEEKMNAETIPKLSQKNYFFLDKRIFLNSRNIVHPCVLLAGRLATNILDSREYLETLIDCLQNVHKVEIPIADESEMQLISKSISHILEKGFFVTQDDFLNFSEYMLVHAGGPHRTILFNKFLIAALETYTYEAGISVAEQNKREISATWFLAVKLVHQAGAHWMQAILHSNRYLDENTGCFTPKTLSPMGELFGFTFQDFGNLLEQKLFGGVLLLVEAQHSLFANEKVKMSIASLTLTSLCRNMQTGKVENVTHELHIVQGTLAMLLDDSCVKVSELITLRNIVPNPAAAANISKRVLRSLKGNKRCVASVSLEDYEGTVDNEKEEVISKNMSSIVQQGEDDDVSNECSGNEDILFDNASK